MTKFYRIKNGFTLIETLIYTAVFVLMSLVVVSLIFSVIETGRQVSPINSLSRGAASSLEVITREIRSTVNVDLTNSVFATSTGSLQLNTLDSSNNSRVIKFYLESGKIKIDENGVFLGPLSSSDVDVTALIFNLSTSTKQVLVGIEMDLTAGSGKYQKSDKFYSSVRSRVDN